MKVASKIFQAIGVVAVVACTVGGVKLLSAQQEAQAEVLRKDKPQPGIVKFAADAPQLSSLKIESVREVALPVAEPVNGRIAYDENVTARVSSPILGRVTKLFGEVGDSIGRGGPLLDIDSPDLAAAEADLQKAKADEARKKLAFDRAINLFEHEVIARKDYESADADYQQAVAETKRAGLRMRNLHATGNENGTFRLRAPISGLIADKQVNPGLEIRPDLPQPLFTITDITHLWVIADVSEKHIAKVKPGQTVNLETDAYPGQRFSAKVDRIGLTLDQGTRRVQVRCVVSNPEKKLRPEMFARVFFLADGEKTGIQIPNTSLILHGIYSYVFVEKSPGVFEKRRVKIALSDSDYSFIDAGLSGGERVVTEGAFLLQSEASSNAS